MNNKTAGILLLLLMVNAALADKEASIWKRNINFQGSAGVYGELYSISGVSRRRPPSSGRMFFRPQMTLFDAVSLRGDFFLSTEGSSARQDLNFYSLHPSWSWGNGHIGDFTENYSKYSFNGKQVRGLGVNLFPGSFRFSLAGGLSDEAVSGNALYKSYKQILFSSQAGYENKRGDRVTLVFLKAKDDKNSLPRTDTLWNEPPISDTMENPLDTVWTNPPELKDEITPAENFVGGLVARTSLFKKALKVEFELNGSAYTKDLATEKINMDSVGLDPVLADLTDMVFQPREGSQFDFAGAAAVRWNKDGLNARFKYDYIGPGYVSLGLPSQVNDRSKFDFSSSYRLKKHRISVKYSRKNDNLLGQKDKTNVRNQLGASYSGSFSNWRSQYHFSFLNQDNNAMEALKRVEYKNISFNTNQSLALKKSMFIQQAGLQYSFQNTDNLQGEKEQSTRYHTLGLSGSGRFNEGIAFSLSAGINYQDSREENRTTQVYSFRLNQSMMKKRLYNSFFVNSSMVRSTKVFRSGVASVFRLTKNNSLKFNFFYNRYRGSRDFDEFRASLNIDHRF